MALSTKWTRAQLRAPVRLELMDPTSRWWSDTEINGYIQDWSDRLQDDLEFVFGTASTAIGSATSTITITDVATDVLRLHDIRWNGRQLVYQSIEELDLLQRDWRAAESATVPYVVWQDDPDIFHLWPPPAEDGTLTMEYPRLFVFGTDTDTSELPPWTRYTVVPYCVMRAHLRQGPNQDVNKALRNKREWERQLSHCRAVKRAYMPEKFPRLKLAGGYEGDLTKPSRIEAMPVPARSTKAIDEVPTGTVNGTNTDFTLTQTPNPAISLKLWVDGVLMQKDTHYTVSTATVTFESAYIPVTGQLLFASYRYAA